MLNHNRTEKHTQGSSKPYLNSLELFKVNYRYNENLPRMIVLVSTVYSLLQLCSASEGEIPCSHLYFANSANVKNHVLSNHRRSLHPGINLGHSDNSYQATTHIRRQLKSIQKSDNSYQLGKVTTHIRFVYRLQITVIKPNCNDLYLTTIRNYKE